MVVVVVPPRDGDSVTFPPSIWMVVVPPLIVVLPPPRFIVVPPTPHVAPPVVPMVVVLVVPPVTPPTVGSTRPEDACPVPEVLVVRVVLVVLLTLDGDPVLTTRVLPPVAVVVLLVRLDLWRRLLLPRTSSTLWLR